MYRIVTCLSLMLAILVGHCAASQAQFGGWTYSQPPAGYFPDRYARNLDYGPPRSAMSAQEASVIANYWIESYFRRHAAPQEVSYWANQLLNRRSPAEALSLLLASREYQDYSGATQTGYIRQLIEDVGHHEASRYEVQDVLAASRGQSPQAIAYQFLRQYPKNWWPGPAATPPRELWQFYGYGYDGRY